MFAVHECGALFLAEILENGSFKSANGVAPSLWQWFKKKKLKESVTENLISSFLHERLKSKM